MTAPATFRAAAASIRSTGHTVDLAAFGKALVAQRTKRKLTGVELARRAGVSPQQLNNIERGRHDPSWKTFIALCRALGVRVPMVE